MVAATLVEVPADAEDAATRAMGLRHLAGQHDQSTHASGEGGVSSGIPRPPAAHTEKVSNYVRDTLGKGAKAKEAEGKILDGMNDYVHRSDVAVRVPSKVLDNILDDGLKNQLQTGKSTGALVSKGLRRDAEQTMFGLPKRAPAEAHPTYGYMELRGVAPHAGVARYGDARLTLKTAVKDRATFTMADSLLSGASGRSLPAPLNDPHIGAADGWGPRVLAASKKPPKAEDIIKTVPYMEVQIHGSVKSKDIARIDFAKKPDAAMQKRLKGLGIEWGTFD